MDLPFISATLGITLVLINPLQALLWTFRRNEHDVINLYNSLSPIMQLATGGDMLNFGYWDGTLEPVSAQGNLCLLVGNTAGLGSARRLIDVGSGLSAPAAQWKSAHNSLDISCVNINFQQLLAAQTNKVSLLNATSTLLPFSDKSADRIVALESAQHFKPLDRFIKESRRVLEPGGLLVIAMPVMACSFGLFKLGILSWTWSSEHYELEYVKSTIGNNGFRIADIRRIGHQVYEPLVDYYILHRSVLRERILKKYPSFLENILYRSLLKMRDLSRKGIIDYIIIKAG
jgi:ubiquinone/menaquinone biosynthesis C-methylase UbiE